PEVSEMIKNNFFDASVKSGQSFKTGDQYTIPRYIDLAGMLYRKDWVEDAGYNPQKEKWSTDGLTWKEFSQITREVMEKQGAKYGFTTQGLIAQTLACSVQ